MRSSSRRGLRTARMRAWAWGLRTKAACSMPGSAMSAQNCPRPSRKRASSSRGSLAPMPKSLAMLRSAPLAPQFLRGDPRAVAERLEFRPDDGGMDFLRAGKGGEAAVGAGDDVVAADHVG